AELVPNTIKSGSFYTSG
ncbi:unnamed protein product, partial [Rotaria sp. Silwood1]